MHIPLSGISVGSLHPMWREGLLVPPVLHKVLASEAKDRNWLWEAAVRLGWQVISISSDSTFKLCKWQLLSPDILEVFYPSCTQLELLSSSLSFLSLKFLKTLYSFKMNTTSLTPIKRPAIKWHVLSSPHPGSPFISLLTDVLLSLEFYTLFSKLHFFFCPLLLTSPDHDLGSSRFSTSIKLLPH